MTEDDTEEYVKWEQMDADRARSSWAALFDGGRSPVRHLFARGAGRQSFVEAGAFVRSGMTIGKKVAIILAKSPQSPEEANWLACP